MSYLYNAWYAAAYADEIGSEPFARRLLDRPIVFYRRSDESIVALHDRCPHRFVPLSRGRVEGDTIICGYHGLRLNCDGACVDDRLNESSRKNVRVRVFPAVERYGVVWIWMGEASRADPKSISDFEFLNDTSRVILKGLTYVKANYRLEIDNLMDLSHLDFVHRATIANGSLTQGQHSMRQEGNRVHSNWWCPNVEMPYQFRPNLQTPDWRCDSWYDMRWDPPGSIKLDVGVCPAGANREGGVDAPQAHLVTPETDGTTWYFWIASLQDFNEPKEVRDEQYRMIAHTFENEDRPLLEAQQQAMGSADFWAERPISFPWDAGALTARKILDKLIAEESERKAPAATAVPSIVSLGSA